MVRLSVARESEEGMMKEMIAADSFGYNKLLLLLLLLVAAIATVGFGVGCLSEMVAFSNRHEV